MVEQEKDFIPDSESLVVIPTKLTLMPGERLLEKHSNFYVSNKRIILHTQNFLGSKTIDHSYKHVKGLEERKKQPFLKLGLFIGIVGIILGLWQPFLFVFGAIFIILAFWFKRHHLVIFHIDGSDIKIPNIKSNTGRRLLEVIRSQVYNKY